MAYDISEIFLTLQGEGHWSGRVAVFCRFARCNLWNGREADRHAAKCTFCDTDFSRNARYESASELADAIEALWPDPMPCSVAGIAPRMVVLTGGEPMLQVDQNLISALHRRRFYVAVETNGTRTMPDDFDLHSLDWVCVSPKAGTRLRATHADEIKVVWPQPGLDLDALSQFPATHHWLSPMDVTHLGGDADNTQACIDYCLAHPQWRLNTQTHKQIGIR